jgi:hypothetical protein
MMSQFRFVMHPDDEQAIASELLKDASIRLIDGPRWKHSKPETSRDLTQIRDYCIVWSVDDVPELAAKFISTCNDWYCHSEHSTIQFLRSSLRGDILTDGRFSVSTDEASVVAASNIERRFKALRRFVKKSYANSVVEWTNVRVPLAPASPSRSANPSKPDSSLWVGPHASRWLLENKIRCIQQSPGAPVEGRLAGAIR